MTTVYCAYCEWEATHVVHTRAGRTVNTCDDHMRKVLMDQMAAPPVYFIKGEPRRLTVDVSIDVRDEGFVQ